MEILWKCYGILCTAILEGPAIPKQRPKPATIAFHESLSCQATSATRECLMEYSFASCLHRWFWPTDQYSKHSNGSLRRLWHRATLLDQHGFVFRLQQRCTDVDGTCAGMLH